MIGLKQANRRLPGEGEIFIQTTKKDANNISAFGQTGRAIIALT